MYIIHSYFYIFSLKREAFWEVFSHSSETGFLNTIDRRLTYYEPDDSLLEDGPVHRSMFSRIPGFYLTEVSSSPPNT